MVFTRIGGQTLCWNMWTKCIQEDEGTGNCFSMRFVAKSSHDGRYKLGWKPQQTHETALSPSTISQVTLDFFGTKDQSCKDHSVTNFFL